MGDGGPRIGEQEWMGIVEFEQPNENRKVEILVE